MKKLNRFLTTALAVIFAAGCIVIYSGVFNDVSAAGDYKYTVKVYSGSEGYFDGDPGKHVKVISGDGFASGKEYSISIDELDLTLVHPDKFYARGVKIAGHDNDDRIFRSGTFWATRDESYSVAYGMKGGMVKYTVSYVDKNGDDLHDSEEFYGMVGDKPVVSYKYVEGYLPQAYNLGKTLQADESKNVFEFVYDEAGSVAGDVDVDEEEDEGEDSDNNANGNNNNGDNVRGGNIPGVNVDGTGNGENGPAEYDDLDDNETPLAGDTDEAGDEKTGFAGLPLGAKIGIIGAAVLAVAAAIAALIRRNMYEYVYEDEDEDEGEDK